MEINVEEIIKRALNQLEYSLNAAEYFIDDYRGLYKEEGDSGYLRGNLFVALCDSNEVISNTSQGSIYHTLMETCGLSSKYGGEFIKLWARAKEIKHKALDEIEGLFEDKNREK